MNEDYISGGLYDTNKYIGEQSKKAGGFCGGIARGIGGLCGGIADGFNKAMDVAGKVGDGIASTIVYIFGEGRDKEKAQLRKCAEAAKEWLDPVRSVKDVVKAFRTGFNRSDEEQKSRLKQKLPDVPGTVGVDLAELELG